MFKRLLPFVALLLLATPVFARGVTPPPVPPPPSGFSCTPSAPLTEYYLDENGNPQSQTLDTLTQPVVLGGVYADYHNASDDCPTHTQNNGVQNCMNWEIPNDLVVEGPNPLGSISDADVNSTIQMFSLWGEAPYSTFVIPAVNPHALTYTNAISPEWKSFGEVKDGTCYRDTIGNAGQLIGDVIEDGGVYSDAPSLCEPHNAKCVALGRHDVEHWIIVVMDNQGVQSNPQTSAEVSLDSRGTCAVMGEPFDSVSTAHNSTCPGTE